MRVAAALVLAACAGLPAPVLAQKGVPPTSVIVGGRPMVSDQDIVDNLAHSADHAVFLALLQSAGMVDALQSHGPFTVFAPTDSAFAALPSGLLDTLRRPENKPSLVALLSMQIVPGIFSSARLHFLQRGKGQTELDTVSGGKLIVGQNGPTNLVLHDPKGDTAGIVIYDAKQANGVIFVTDRVMQPG